jgi:hypothetical protein
MCFCVRGYRRGGREAMRKRRDAALGADRLSAYEANQRVERRSVNRLLFEFVPGERLHPGCGVFRETSIEGTTLGLSGMALWAY